MPAGDERRGRVYAGLGLFFGLWAQLLSPVVIAAASGEAADSYLAALQARAKAQHLADHPYWHRLLHYRPDWLGSGVTSTVVSPWFFASPRGRHDPRAELRATLRAFFVRSPRPPRNEPAQCLWAARYAWLDSRLHFDLQRLPRQDCPALTKWLQVLNVASVAVVFPTAYLNSPASMFGHTFLRLDAHGQDRSQRLLAYAVNYAADTNERNGVLFAIKGIFGGYAGRYGLYPYYDKVKQYARIENRDLWSYRLNLDAEEIRRLLLHLWELKGAGQPYLFFTRNCSRELLTLLGVARPRLHLAERFDFYTIPTDTLRALTAQPGLVSNVSYRPSRRTELVYHYRQLSAPGRRVARALASGRLNPRAAALQALSDRARARALQVAYVLEQYRFVAGELPRSQAAPRARRILLARSQVPVTAPVFTPPPRPAVAPDAGHGTARIAVGLEVEKGRGDLFLRLRPAYHDLLDPPGGYQAGAQINFLDIGLAYRPGEGVRFRDAKLIDIVSISPRTELFSPISWQVATGVRRAPAAPLFSAHPGHVGYYLQGGPGLAYGRQSKLVGYGFLLGSLDANPGLTNALRPGVGLSLGVLSYPGAHWSLLAELGGLGYAATANRYYLWSRLGLQWQLARNHGLRLRLAHEATERGGWNRLSLGYRFYF
ncbi:MAG: DUF4105 domain-containing protein [Nitrococcus sp.]|nr:DUF4105 domain-containing protein [Nitrococcus sp.]